MWASTLWPFSSSTRNIALGNGSTTVPSTRIVSSLGLATGHHRGLRARARHAEVLRGDPGGYLRSGAKGNPGPELGSDAEWGGALAPPHSHRLPNHLRSVGPARSLGDVDVTTGHGDLLDPLDLALLVRVTRRQLAGH